MNRRRLRVIFYLLPVLMLVMLLLFHFETQKIYNSKRLPTNSTGSGPEYNKLEQEANRTRGNRPTQNTSNAQDSSLQDSKENELTQINMKRKMRDYCLTHQFVVKPTSLEFIFVDDTFKIMYCAIAKVGSTTLKTIFARLHNRSFSDRYGVHFWTRGMRGTRKLSPLSSYNEEQRAIRLKTYFKFMFVREPLHRLLSSFKDKFIGPDLGITVGERNAIIRTYRPQDFVSNGKNMVTFPEFIKYYSGDRNRDHHWRQYEKLCHPCAINYDFIGKMENLAEDGPHLLKMAGLDKKINFPPVHKQTSSDEVMTYFSQVPPEDIKRMGEQYASDFFMFGYEYLGPVKSLLERS